MNRSAEQCDEADAVIRLGSDCAVEVFRQVHPQLEAMSEVDRHRWLSGFMIGTVTYMEQVLGRKNTALSCHSAVVLMEECSSDH